MVILGKIMMLTLLSSSRFYLIIRPSYFVQIRNGTALMLTKYTKYLTIDVVAHNILLY
jgi:hypothetical protein